MKNILLVGIDGVYNYGCEAIVRGTTSILKQTFPDANISYVSYSYSYDSKRLNDLDITIVKRRDKSRRWTVRNIIRKLFPSIGKRIFPDYDTPKLADKFDAIFSIGGDIYTLTASNQANLSLPQFIDSCIKTHPDIKYIVWGASIGPFDTNQEALKYYQQHLAKASLIVAREQVTIDYLSRIGISQNVRFAPDPAFFVPTDDICDKPSRDRLRIGINLSPMSTKYSYANPEQGIKAQANTIQQIIRTLNAEIYLIPHVLASSIGDDDLRYLQNVFNHIDDQSKRHVHLETADAGFIGRKKILSTMDCMIAARMHCAINAMTCGIPTILLSYSAKAKGMAQLVYGDSSMLCPLTDFEKSDQMLNMISNRKNPININTLKQFNFNEILK